MGWFSKDEEVPEIPKAPTLPDLPKPAAPASEKKDLPELPSFPSTPANENLNQEMVKSAVADHASEEKELTVEIPEGLHVQEEPAGSMIPPRPSAAESIPPMPKRTLELNAAVPDKPVTKQIEPIFVRIDKFQSAQKNFELVKSKVKDIETVLKKIKDVKTREEEELADWATEIEKIKIRLSEVDSSVFSQV